MGTSFYRMPKILRCLAGLFFALSAPWPSHAQLQSVLSAPDRVVTNLIGTPIAMTHLHHVFRASPKVYSGEAPETAAAFEEIAKLGIKTIISVDGTKPDVVSARQYGLRYIHLPFGYDGVPTQRVAELIKATQSPDDPVYVHCHHGLHRGPAAVAVICEGTAGWSTNQALLWLEQAGTSPDYAGLFRSAAEFRQPDTGALASVRKLPEIAETTSWVDAMVAIDLEFDRLKAVGATGWSTSANQSSRKPVESATVLWEHFRELGRTQNRAEKPVEFWTKLLAAENAAGKLRGLLQDSKSSAARRENAWQSLSQACTSCHRAFRN